MTNSCNSAVARAPCEIWWMIFDEVLDVPFHFSLTYTGDNWARDLHLANDDQSYKESERQRKTIGSVCKTWRRYSEQRRYRRISSSDTNLPPSVLAHAHRVDAGWGSLHKALLSLNSETNWEILSVSQNYAEEIAQKYPLVHLRRLQLITGNIELMTNAFLDTIQSFMHITWLEYLTSVIDKSSIPPIEHQSPVVLPNLRVLINKSYGRFIFPFEYLELPSLEQLAVICYMQSQDFPLRNLLLSYRKSLRSVFIKVDPVSRVTYPTFPQWSEFPRLEELVLDRAFKPHFHPLPRKHPLRKIVTQSWREAEIESWMDSDNLREIGLLYNCPGTNLGDERDTMTEQEIDRLFEKADTRGVNIEVGDLSYGCIY